MSKWFFGVKLCQMFSVGKSNALDSKVWFNNLIIFTSGSKATLDEWSARIYQMREAPDLSFRHRLGEAYLHKWTSFCWSGDNGNIFTILFSNQNKSIKKKIIWFGYFKIYFFFKIKNNNSTQILWLSLTSNFSVTLQTIEVSLRYSVYTKLSCQCDVINHDVTMPCKLWRVLNFFSFPWVCSSVQSVERACLAIIYICLSLLWFANIKRFVLNFNIV